MKKILYTPLTATPFKQTEKYRERLPQTPDLTRYIRCFWGSEMPYVANESSPSTTVIVPDTCADIIYHIDYTADTITGQTASGGGSCCADNPFAERGPAYGAAGRRMLYQRQTAGAAIPRIYRHHAQKAL